VSTIQELLIGSIIFNHDGDAIGGGRLDLPVAKKPLGK
jgi:hypothetical protein